MSNSRWKPWSEFPKDREGTYFVWAPSDEYGQPYVSGNVAIYRYAKIANGYLGSVDGKFYFDAAVPEYFREIDDLLVDLPVFEENTK